MLFDVFGTVVDWRSSITAEARAVGRKLGVEGDWTAFADRWRQGYHDGMKRVNAGDAEWVNVDVIHRERLDLLLDEYGMGGMAEEEKAHLNRAWHRLDPWPDSVAGLTQLKGKYVIGTLSNGNVALLVNMAKHAGLPWDVVLSSELVGRYKPDPAVYRRAAELLGLLPGEVMMVAAHVGDLRAAKSAGLRTGFVTRPLEFGPEGRADVEPDPDFDVAASDFVDLAEKLGA